jgi:MYXO-CTERM domain-containing protein
MSFATSLLVPQLLVMVFAGDPPVTTTPDPQGIFGGQGVNTCGWPSVVLLRGNGYLCSGNLIHPEIVATAAHCLASMGTDTRVYFGDTANSSHEKVDVEYCMGSPDFIDNGDGTIPFSEVGNDWGFCKLAAPVTDVTPIPAISGCEVDLLQEGAEIVRVGFGKETLATNQFFKRWVDTHIVSIPFTGANGWPTQLSEGGGGVGTCPGDSGGPAFIRVPASAGGDDSWRMIAIQSTQPVEDGAGEPIECGTLPNNTAVISQGLAFIEAESGIDVTPCFDTDGGWEPSFGCAAFPLDPGAGGGNWSAGCDPGPMTEFSAACGLPFDELHPDETPPVLTIVDPPGPVDLAYEGAPVVVNVLVDADDGPDGWGMSHVELLILDAETLEQIAAFPDTDADFTWQPEFPKGAYLIQAVGHDNAGHITQTETLAIDIGVEPAADDDGGTGAEGEGTGEAGTGGDEGAADGNATTGSQSGTGDDAGDGSSGTSPGGAADGDDGGCSCRTSGGPSGALLGPLVLLGLLGRRRRL